MDRAGQVKLALPILTFFCLLPDMLGSSDPLACRAVPAGEPPAEVRPKEEARDPLYRELVAQASRAHGVSARLLHAVIRAESNYEANAVSRAGALGLMQVMPGTASRYGVDDALDPAANIAAGAQYLRSLLARYEGDLVLALAAYNAGEGAIARHGGVPPYPETTRYIERVLDYYERGR
jgi:soluble lytic murein transglycosylase-like protein